MTNIFTKLHLKGNLSRWAALIVLFGMYSGIAISQPMVYRDKTFNGDIRFVLGPEDSGTKFINCTFKNYVGGADVLRIAGATDILIRGCTFVNIQGDEKGRDMHAIACPQNGKGIVIENCTFKNIAADGIQMGHQGTSIRNWIIRNNHFEQCGENGVDIKKVNGNILVAGNTFSEHTGCPPGSIGCTGGSGTGLVIHHGASGVTVENNRFYKNIRGVAVFVTNNSMVPNNIKIVNNFFYQNRKGLLMHHGTNISIHHNTFVSHTEKHLSVTDPIGSWLSYKNNLLVGSGKILTKYKGQGNLYIPSVVDARFFNPGEKDYRLRANSPAVDAGATVSRVTTDWKGISRPQGGRHDVGADEKKIMDNPPEEVPPAEQSGLTYHYYEGSWNTLSDLSRQSSIKQGTTNNFTLNPRQRNDDFGFVFEGYIRIDRSGTYTFFTTSDDGSQLYIDAKKIVDNDGQHSKRERSGQVSLSVGWHPIQVLYFEQTGEQVLRIQYKGPDISKRDIPDNALSVQPESNSVARKYLPINKQHQAVVKEKSSLAHSLSSEATTVRIYPNPVNDQLHLSLPKTPEGTNYTLQIRDSRGIVLLEEITTADTPTLNLAPYALPAGLYYLWVENPAGLPKVVKLLKK